ncbi:YdcF family protein [Spirochaeta dissipatitropha]
MIRILQDLIEAFLWPPGNIILLLLLAVLLVTVFRKRKLPAVMLLCLTAAGIYLFSTELVSSAILKNLENRHSHVEFTDAGLEDFAYRLISEQENKERESLIVVLGGGTVPGSPDKIGIRPDALSRLSAAYLLHRHTGFPVLVSGGIVRNREESISEAELFADWLTAAGVDRKDIIIENRSTTTAENASQVINLLRNENPKPKLILVTSAYHMPRSVYSFSAYTGEILTAPVDFKAVRSSPIFQSFLPDLNSLRNSSIAMREYLGLIIYALLSN